MKIEDTTPTRSREFTITLSEEEMRDLYYLLSHRYVPLPIGTYSPSQMTCVLAQDNEFSLAIKEVYRADRG